MRPTRAGRLWGYLGEMFPPAVHLPAALASFAAVYLTLEALDGHTPLRLGWRALAGAVSLFLFSLLLRVYDELKDVETDLRLGRAGDPRYRDRAIVTGRVTVADLRALRWTVTALLVAANLPLGALPLAAFAAVFLLTWLSYHWFFSKAVERNLLLAFVTHNPLALALGLYVVAIYARDFGPPSKVALAALLLLGCWMPVAAWETARKVRAPADETDYQTYSKILGVRVAALLPALFIVAAVVCLTWVARAAGLGWIYPAALTLVGLVGVGASVRAFIAPSRDNTNLRSYAEALALTATVGLPIALCIHYGVA